MSLQEISEPRVAINGPAISRQLRDLREDVIRSNERFECFSRVIKLVNGYLEDANAAYERGDRQAGDLHMAGYQAAYAALKAINGEV